MSDEQLIEFLLKMSEDEKLTEEESDVLVLVVRILEKKDNRKETALIALRAALHAVGNT